MASRELGLGPKTVYLNKAAAGAARGERGGGGGGQAAGVGSFCHSGHFDNGKPLTRALPDPWIPEPNNYGRAVLNLPQMTN